uniref:Uncharacterized protein n=1 Tax=Oryza punctata TaxID=4537 RepID=A0A0E0M3B1_ORYPU
MRRRGSTGRVPKRVCLSDILGMSQMRGSGVLHVCTSKGLQLGIADQMSISTRALHDCNHKS